MANWTLTVNGEPRTFEADPNMPLLWALRDLLGLTGTKFGCGVGLCGACTVHVDGQAMRSCMVLVSAASGKHIMTIEGLSPTGDHPVQKAWLEAQVPQCGYCQPGKIMTAAALLSQTPHPIDEEIDAAYSNHLCRCGTYLRIRAAIHRAAEGG